MTSSIQTNKHNFLNILKKTNPAMLLRIFTLVSFLSMIIILVLVNAGIRIINMNQHIKEAEHDAIGISQAIYQHEEEMLIAYDLNGEKTLSIDKENFAKIDKSMNDFLTPLNIIKIKIFSKDGRIAYSTDHTIIGQIDTHNENLNRALNGEIVSKLEYKDEIWDIAGEQKHDIDLVETYLPVRDKNKNIIGIFELYLDITRYKAASEEAIRLSMMIITMILFLTFGFLFILMKKVTNQLNRNEAILRENEEHFRSVVGTAKDAIITIDSNGEIVFWNSSAEEIIGYTPDEVIGKPITLMIPKQFHEAHKKGLDRVVNGDNRHVIGKTVELAARRKDGAEFPIELSLAKWETSKGVFFTAVIREISERKKMEGKLKALSLKDELTGLNNRRGFINLTEQQLKLAKRAKEKVFLLYLDLDRFKEINDTLGHNKGDEALKDIAMILKDTYRESDTIGRMGGDEFVVFSIGTDSETIKIVVDRLLKNIDIQNRESNKSYKLSVSIGVASFDPESPCSLDKLLAQADKLMYEQKRKKHG